MNLNYQEKYSKKTNYAIGKHVLAGTIPYMDPIYYR